jgi:hypothetical protein
MEADITVESVKAVESRSGNTRYVLRDSEGREYTTFRPKIGEEAAGYEGRRARIEFHEEDRKGFHNVYLDAIHPAPAAEPAADQPGDGSDAEEAAWTAAVDAAPWLLGESEPQKAVPPERFFKKLKPLKDLVAEDIRESSEEDDPEDD